MKPRITMHVQVVPFNIHRLILYLYVALHQHCLKVDLRERLKKRLNDSKHCSFDEGDHYYVGLCSTVCSCSIIQSQCCHRFAYRKRPGLTNRMFFLAGEMRFGKEDAHTWMRFVCLFVGAAEFKEVGLTDTGRDSDGNKQVFLMDI